MIPQAFFWTFFQEIGLKSIHGGPILDFPSMVEMENSRFRCGLNLDTAGSSHHFLRVFANFIL